MAPVRPPRPLPSSKSLCSRGSSQRAAYRSLQLLLPATMVLLLSASAPSPFAEGIVLKGSGPDPKAFSSLAVLTGDDVETDSPSEDASVGDDLDGDEDEDEDEGGGSGSNPIGTCATTSTYGGSTVSHSFCLQLASGLNVSWSLAAASTADVIVRATTAVPYGWVGFGLSASCRMVGSSVVIGYVNADDTTQSAAATFALTSYTVGSAVSASSGSFLAGTPSLEVAAGGGSYALRFNLILPSGSSQCVVWARGPALSGSAFANTPVPGFSMHIQQGSSRFDFATGTAVSSSPSPSPPSPSPNLPPASTKSPPKSSPAKSPPKSSPAKSPPKASPAKSPPKASPAKSPPKASPLKSPPKASPAKSPPRSSPPKSPPKSPPLKSPPPSPKSPPLTPKSPPPAGGCTDTFGGVTVPQSFCVNLGSGVTLSWTLSGKTANAIVRASTSESYGWIGFGLSPSCAMVGSQVLMGYANSASPSQIAVRPFIAKSYITGQALASPTTTFTVGSPTVEVLDSSTVAMRFGVQLTTTGRQCVVFAKGPALTATQFAQTPVPGFQYHSGGSAIKRVNFATGILG